MWLVAVDPVLDFDLRDAIEQARERVGLTHKGLAFLMGIESQQLSHQLSGREALNFRRLLFCARRDEGKEFLRELLGIVGEHIGLEDRDLIARRLGQLVDALQVRNAKAELRARERQRA